MRKIGRFLLFAGMLALSAKCPASGTGENLLSNASFEDGLAKWSVASWRTCAITPEIDNAIFHAPGKAALKCVGEKGKETYVIQNARPLTDARKYKIEGWIKTEGFQNGWQAAITVQCDYQSAKDGKTQYKYFGASTPKTGETEWRKFETEFEIPEGTSNMQVILKTSHDSGKIADAPQNTGTAWFDDISLSAVEYVKADKIAARRVWTLSDGNLFNPGDAPEISIELANYSSSSKKALFHALIKDYDGKILAELKKTIELEPGKSVVEKIKSPSLDIGYYTCEASLFSIEKGNLIDSKVIGVAVPVPPSANEGGSFVAMNYHGGYKVGWFKRIGVQSMEMVFDFNLIEPENNKYDEKRTSALAKHLENIKGQGITPIGHVCIDVNRIPAWASSAPDPKERAQYMAKPEYFEEFMFQMVKRFGKDIRTWQLSCEIDARNGNLKRGFDEYYDMIRAGYKGAKRADPDVIIGGCGVSDYDVANNFKYSKKIWENIHDSLDGMFFDSYTGSREFGENRRVIWPEEYLEKAVGRAREIVSKYGNKKVAVHEIGWTVDNSLPVSHKAYKARAALIARLYLLMRPMDIEHVIWFLLYSEGKALEGTGEYGMFRLSPKDEGYPNPGPEVCSYAAMAKFLSGVKSAEKVSIHDSIYSCLCDRKNGVGLALWTTEKEPLSLKIDLPETAVISDLIGRPLPVDKKNGKTLLNLSGAPIYVVDEKADKKRYVSALKSAEYTLPPAEINHAWKRFDTVDVRIKNKLNKELKGALKIGEKGGGSAEEFAVALSPGAEKTVSCKMKGPKPGADTAPALNVSLRTDDGFAVEQEIPKTKLYRVAKLNKKMSIDGDLGKYSGIAPIELSSGDIRPQPAVIYGGWTGTGDLAVKAWTAYDDDFFYLAAEVCDDTHNQKMRDDCIWNADCIQFGFDPTNNAKLFPERAGYNIDEGGREFGIALTERGPGMFCWIGQASGLVKSPMLAVKRDEKQKKTFYELAIPWKDLSPMKPEAGKIFGFNFICADRDETKDYYWMQLSDGIANGKMPALFGNFILAP